MKRLGLAAALGLLGWLSAGQASAQMEGLSNGGLGDARAQNQPTSAGINMAMEAQDTDMRLRRPAPDM